MSFILDALRKSETERQKKAAPGIVDSHYQRPDKRRNIWLPLLVVILAANAEGNIYLLDSTTGALQRKFSTAYGERDSDVYPLVLSKAMK